MVPLSSDFTGCPVLVCTPDGRTLLRTEVTDYNRDLMRVRLEEMPESLDVGDSCLLLILTEPNPCEYRGKVQYVYPSKAIALYKGQVKENRSVHRYKLKMTALITHLLYDGKPYAMLNPLEVELLNISTGGLRFRAPHDSLSLGDKFNICIKINDIEKKLITEVVNHTIRDGCCEYGCRFHGNWDKE